MDGKFLTTVSKYLDNIELFPYFNICHYVILSIQVRELSPGKKTFTRQHPLASWVATMVMCFAGSLLSNFLIGEAMIIPIKYHENILHASLCWYLVNYFPFDLCYKITSFLPVYLIIYLAKEFYRCKMVSIGISVAAKRYPDSFLVWLMIGMSKGCGEDILIPIAQACMGELTTNQLFLIKPTFNVKGSLAVATMFGLEKLQKVPLASNQLFLAALMFMTYFRISHLIVGIKDPFIPFENIICGLFFGGLIDAIKRVSSTPSNNQAADGETNESPIRTGNDNEEAESCRDCGGHGDASYYDKQQMNSTSAGTNINGDSNTNDCYDDINDMSYSNSNNNNVDDIDDDDNGPADDFDDDHAHKTSGNVSMTSQQSQPQQKLKSAKKKKNKVK